MPLNRALDIARGYLISLSDGAGIRDTIDEVLTLTGAESHDFDAQSIKAVSYDDAQFMLSKLNEKEAIRKNKGVYYTPNDVVRFIVSNTVKSSFGVLEPDNIGNEDLNGIPVKGFATSTSIFDPTCGAGEYLLAALEMKLDLLEEHYNELSEQVIADTVSTIYGTDINEESVTITKLRLYLCLLNRCGSEKCRGVAGIINNNFFSCDYISSPGTDKYDIIIGNPPYVEDIKSGLDLHEKYGNIYANVLVNASKQLSENGSIGFIIPLSYISTPRMNKLRKELVSLLPKQYILSYADRPDCLFDSVHQKLCILIGTRIKEEVSIFTGNYQYWYKEERSQLFSRTTVVRNVYATDKFIPKLGNNIDIDIYRKVTLPETVHSVYEMSRKGKESVYLNRRETFWMKAYRDKVDDPEYKVFSFRSRELADYCYCLINSSLFWWFWICTSDCWHVSKELNGFKAPFDGDYRQAIPLANDLRKRLEKTKIYVGTKQTKYEYKHRDCIPEIHRIDDYINELYGLSDAESQYIKDFAFRYRTSGGSIGSEGD